MQAKPGEWRVKPVATSLSVSFRIRRGHDDHASHLGRMSRLQDEQRRLALNGRETTGVQKLSNRVAHF